MTIRADDEDLQDLLQTIRGAIITVGAIYAEGGGRRIRANDHDIQPQAEAFARIIMAAITPALIEKALNAAKGATRPLHLTHLTPQ